MPLQRYAHEIDNYGQGNNCLGRVWERLMAQFNREDRLSKKRGKRKTKSSLVKDQGGT